MHKKRSNRLTVKLGDPPQFFWARLLTQFKFEWICVGMKVFV